MAELSVIIILALGALTTAGWTVIRLVRLLPSETEDDRLKRALQSAADGVARRQLRIVAATLGLEAAAALVAVKVLTGALAWWLGLGLALGTASVFLVSQVSVGLSIHAASAAARLTASGEQSVVLSLRSGASLTAFAGGLALFWGAGTLLAVRTGETAGPLGFLAGTVIGGLGAVLVLHTSGAALRLAAVTSRTSSPGSSKLPHYCLDSTNPSLILDLVTQHTGAAQAHAQRVFWVFGLQQTFALMLSSGDANSAALLATTLITQGVSLVSASTIQGALRASDGVRTWSSALGSGLVANGVLSLVALAGAGYWLLGETFRPLFGIYALLGAALTVATVASTGRGSARHTRRLEAQDLVRRPALDVGFAVPAAFQAAAFAGGVLLTTLLVVAYLCPEPAAFPAALWWLTTGGLISLPFLEAQAQLEPLTESAASLSSLRTEAGRGEPHAHLGSLCAVGQLAGVSSQRAFAVISCLLAVLGVAQLSSQTPASASVSSQAVQALAAMVVVFGALALVARRATLTALIGVSEVSRHQRSEGDPSLRPGYAHFVEELTGRALQGGIWSSGSIVLTILLAVLVIRHFSSIPHEGPTTFLAFVATGGISVSLLGVGVAAFVGVARGFRRGATGSSPSPVSDSLNTAHMGLADLAGFVVAPTALVLVHLTVAVALAVTSVAQ